MTERDRSFLFLYIFSGAQKIFWGWTNLFSSFLFKGAKTGVGGGGATKKGGQEIICLGDKMKRKKRSGQTFFSEGQGGGEGEGGISGPMRGQQIHFF